MEYKRITQAVFLNRPNRFIAYVELCGQRTKVHVKNTGRCRELLQEGALVYLEESDNKERFTAYDLVGVNKDGRLVNMDSSAPNQVVGEWLQEKILIPDLTYLRPEMTYGNSRFDFYAETASGRKIFIEVKGVTLEIDGVAAFPDAPSERALKHVEELIKALEEGYEAYLLFVIQMKGVGCFVPNTAAQPEFTEALKKARRAGMHLLAYDCIVEENGLKIADEVPIVLSPLDRIIKPLLEWYDKGRRILPWRTDPAPYHVWLSEIMLQQTRVEAVKPYYDRFLKELPDIRSLSEVSEEQLLKLWEGLGYYNRVRNLKRAAEQIVEKYGGRMPNGYEELLALPGIGSYTAGAIYSIAFGGVKPAVDGNVLRILARLRMDGRDILDVKVKRDIEEELEEIIPEDRPGDFNQALMELGAVICIPNGIARCSACPFEAFCEAHRVGRVSEFPKKAGKRPRTIEKKTILVIRDGDRLALHKRPGKGLLAGMYEFPSMEGWQKEEAVLAYLKQIGLKIIRIRKLADSKHIFTHKEWHMTGYMVRVDELEKMVSETKEEWFYVTPAQIKKQYPVPSAFAAYMEAMEVKLGI